MDENQIIVLQDIQDLVLIMEMNSFYVCNLETIYDSHLFLKHLKSKVVLFTSRSF